MKNKASKLLSVLLIISITVSYISLLMPYSAATAGYQAGYTFDDNSNLRWDLGGKYHLIERDFSPFEARSGKSGNAVSSYFSLEQSMFSKISELTLSFWVDFSEFDASFDSRLFYVGNGNETYAYLSLDFVSYDNTLSLTLFDGRYRETLIADISPEISLSGWHHIVFTYDVVGQSNKITFYVDGFTRSSRTTDAALDTLTTNVIFFTDFVIDDLYISNIALSSDNVLKLNVMDLKDFFTSMGGEIIDVVPDTPDNPDDNPDNPTPVDPDNPDEPVDIPPEDQPGEEEGWKPPENLDRIKFSWLAYTFDTTYDISRDLNKTTSAIINEFAVTRVATADYKGSFAYGLTKRSAATPNQYLKLNPGLLYQADAFTFCAWVYRVADKDDTFYHYSPIKLLDFSGYGKFEFSPFKTSQVPPEIYQTLVPSETTDELSPETAAEPTVTLPAAEEQPLQIDFTDAPVLEFAADAAFPTANALSKTSLNNINGKWVHYALSYSQSGEVKIYVNGVLTDTFHTGMPFSALQITDFKILSGSEIFDTSKYIIDEVYLASRVVDASDIRKIRAYGIKRFTTEVLPDPSPETNTPSVAPTSSENIDLRPDDTDNLEDSYTERAEISDFIGTTFDDTSLIGKDINNSVIAVIRNASLSQGIKNYGLTLDGINSYIRYPIGILDNAAELTLSVAYNWTGNTSSATQKLVYFSKKVNSISKPSAYMLIDMGNGSDGLSFEINDGSAKTTLKSSTSLTNEWVRVTVTIKDGTARLYINGALVDHASTSISPAAIAPNFNYIGKSGVKGEPLFKGVVDDIYISPTALTAQEIQAFEEHGIEPYVPTENVVEENSDDNDIWDTIINGVVIATGVLIFIIIIVIIVTIFKK
ncbi:MAG: hypothetical protein IJL30_04045 [Clostridia bacterium]|nr:hypothetical protein [Clostridia bacterium]